VITYAIGSDGKSITCLRCKMTSFNINDVVHLYCGQCHAFHVDRWYVECDSNSVLTSNRSTGQGQ
jgi:hypothetical protein